MLFGLYGDALLPVTKGSAPPNTMFDWEDLLYNSVLHLSNNRYVLLLGSTDMQHKAIDTVGTNANPEGRRRRCQTNIDQEIRYSGINLLSDVST